MQFLSDNAAAVHPAFWRAMQAADAPDVPYAGDRRSARLDDAFSALGQLARARGLGFHMDGARFANAAL